MQDPTYPLIPIASVLAAVLVLLTLITSGVRGAYNRGVIMFEGWVFVGLLITSSQSIVWRNTDADIAPIFCDVSSHLTIGLTVGIPACSFAITRRLWLVVHGDSPTAVGRSQLPREIFIDYFLGLGLPVLSMTLYYIVQGVRFMIVEDYGCSTAVYQSGVAILLLEVWPLVFPVASVTLYSWRIVLHLHRHKRTVDGVLRYTTGMNRSSYVRALALGCVDILLSLPVGIISFFLSVSFGSITDLQFWPGWSEIHNAMDLVSTAAEADPSFRFRIYWRSYVRVFFAIAIFALFGLNIESRKIYSGIFRRTKDGAFVFKKWSSGVITSTLVPQSAALPQHTIEIRYHSRKSLVEKRQRRDEEMSAELVTLHSLESGFAGAITVDIEIGEEIYRPGGIDGAVLF